MSESKITQKALAITIKELMQELPFPKINVQIICEKCGISRKSFYYHFKDKYDLVNWIFYTEHLCLMTTKNYSNCFQYFDDLCNYLYQNKAFYQKALEYSGQNSFQDYFFEAYRSYFSEFYKNFLKNQNKSNLDFIVNVSMQIIITWLKNNEEIKPKEFENLLKESIKGIYTIMVSEDALENK